MAGFGLMLSLLLVPDIQQTDKISTKDGAGEDGKTVKTKQLIWKQFIEVLAKFNPVKIFRPLKYPNVLFAVSPLFLLASAIDQNEFARAVY